MSAWFTADTHFNHRQIIGHCGRPFDSAEGMNEVLIANWNSRVGDRDEIFVLGDFGFSRSDSESVESIFARLRGRKHLVIGNHDLKNPKVLKLPWVWAEPAATFKCGGHRAELLHYPMETWNRAHWGAMHFHGHSHGSLATHRPRRFDVGVDTADYAPIAWETLVKRAQRENYMPVDHHREVE